MKPGLEFQINRQLLSVVVPCYDEEEVLEETLRRLKIFCSELQNLDAELIFGRRRQP